MVAGHFRWDFYGLSTDSKPTATNPRVADGSTYYEADTSKLYVWYNDQWYEKQAGGELPVATSETLGGIKVGDGLSITEGGVLSASGGGGGSSIARTLTTDDLVDGKFKLWLLDSGIYHIPKMENTLVFVSSSDDYWTDDQIAIISRTNGVNTSSVQIIFMDEGFGVFLFNVAAINGYRNSKGTIATN